MLRNAYIKDKMIHLVFAEEYVEEHVGVTYEIGKHLTDFLWFDIDGVDGAYESFIHFYIKAVYEHKNPMDEVKRDLSARMDLLDAFSPYLHFYTRLLFDFMIDYPKDKRGAVTALSQALTNKGKVLTPFIYEIRRTAENFCATGAEVAEGAMKAKSAILEDLKAKREDLFKEFEFLCHPENEWPDMSVMQRLYLLDFKRKQEGNSPYYTEVAFTSRFVPSHPLVNKPETAEQLATILQKSHIDVVQMYAIHDLDELIRFEMLSVITHELPLKKCKYCGHYFVPSGRSDTEYCSRIDAEENKPCDQIGAMKLYQAKKEDDPVEKAFKKAYRRMNSKSRRKIISQSNFYIWSKEARKKREECHSGNLTLDEYENWLSGDK